MNLEQIMDEIENIKLLLKCFGCTQVILHNIDREGEYDMPSYSPIQLCVVPAIHYPQVGIISYVLSSLFHTKFEIQCSDETDGYLLSLNDPNNGVDILNNSRDQIKAAVLKIFETSEVGLHTIQFSAPPSLIPLNVPKEWKILLTKAQDLIQSINKKKTEEHIREKADSLKKEFAEKIIPPTSPVIFSGKRAKPESSSQSSAGTEEESPPRKIARALYSARSCDETEEFWKKLREMMALADTTEHQQVCMHELDALIAQEKSSKPIITGH